MAESADEQGSTTAPLSDPDDVATTPPKLSEDLTAPLSRPREWLFLVENRLVVASGIIAALFALFLGVEAATEITAERHTPLFYAFSALIGGNFTLVTIVVSISQLVISQQLGSPGELRERIEEANEYREAVEERTEPNVAPVTPTDFLQLLLEQTNTNVDRVDDQLDAISDPEAREALEELLSGIAIHVEQVYTLLAQSEVGLFEALSVTLQTNYSQDIYRIRRVQTDYGDHFPEEVEDTLHDLMVRLKQIDVARQYLKTLYMQDELARISRLLLYTGLPAVVVAALMLHQFAGGTSALIPPPLLSKLVPIALTIGVAPLTVLFAFVLRISMVAQRTAAITPFTTPSQETDLTLASTVEEKMSPEQTDD
jgi:hypothetical protein